MRNLLKETLREFRVINKTPDDIKWIGTRDGEYYCTWKKFKQLADIEYDDGFRGQEVKGDLVIVFKDNTYLERYTCYPGRHGWWSYKKCPTLKPNPKSIEKVIYETWLDNTKGEI